MKTIYYTHKCVELDATKIGECVVVSGWVESIRDHGGILFLDLRDTSDTLLQVVSHDDSIFRTLTKETVIKVTGIIQKRDGETIDKKRSTGEIELLVDTLDVLSKAKPSLPFDLRSEKGVKEDVRLKYRYLDLRRTKMHDIVTLRSELLYYLRDKMHKLGFTEVQTPILTASSPEGARDFVVPSRLFKGKFYALPQAPQIYKELLMVGGIDKYFQIAPCFRDEDARADRTLEFYQLDMEMSFVSEEDVLSIGQKIFYDTFTKFSKKKVGSKTFKRLTYREAMNMYGTDKPDLRIPLIIKDVSDDLKATTFGPFKKSTIKAIVVDDIGSKSSSWFQTIVDYAISIGMPGIGYITLLEDGTLKGPIDKFLSSEVKKSLITKYGMKKDTVMFFIADHHKHVADKLAGQMRIFIGKKAGLLDDTKHEFCIVKDFPMFEYDEKLKKIIFAHNPFSMPKGSVKDFYEKDPLDIVASQFDFVCDGYEIASGAIRNHDLTGIIKGFEIAGYKEGEILEKFKSITEAFKYGAPPMGGMAPGIDRMLMLITGEDSIREVQTFPTSASAQDLMMGSPSILTKEQLDELGIKFDLEK